MQCLTQYKFPISLDSSLDLSRRKSLRGNHIFAKQVSIKVNCIFLHKITGLAQNLPISNNQPFYQKKLNLWDFSLLLAFSFNKSDVSASRHSSRNAAIHEKKQGVSPHFLTITSNRSNRLKFRLKSGQIKSNTYSY